MTVSPKMSKESVEQVYIDGQSLVGPENPNDSDEADATPK